MKISNRQVANFDTLFSIIPVCFTRKIAIDRQIEKTNESGFSINLGLGGDYKIGLPVVFGEAGIALPANKVNDSYVDNVIPPHFAFNLGIRVPFGESNH